MNVRANSDDNWETGSMQYALSGWANVWDYAAGIIIVREAGGTTMTPTAEGWRDMTGWSDLYAADTEASKRFRSWKGPVLSSTLETARFISANLVPRRPGLLQRAWRSVRS